MIVVNLWPKFTEAELRLNGLRLNKIIFNKLMLNRLIGAERMQLARIGDIIIS